MFAENTAWFAELIRAIKKKFRNTTKHPRNYFIKFIGFTIKSKSSAFNAN